MNSSFYYSANLLIVFFFISEMKSKDAIPLGDFYLFPNQSRNAVEESKSNLSNMDSSILCCSYNIYLASTNLIFQPCTRRIRLEPISLQTIQTRGKKGNIIQTETKL